MATATEFGFELRVCQWAERRWPPERDDDVTPVVARQLGTARRRWDTVVVESTADALADRAAFGERELDSDLLDVVPHAPAEWTWYQDALPDPGYPWEYVREAVHRAADRGLVESRKRANRVELRRRHGYPDWVDRVVAIENKPDLDASAARRLARQVERDVALGLADEVWVATRATGAAVEPVLLEDLPPEVGVLAVDPTPPSPGRRGDASPPAVDVVWHPRSLAPDEPGTRIEARADGDAAARFDVADPDWKATKRAEIAERAYGRGWRSYGDALRTDCRHCEIRQAPDGAAPHCTAKDRAPTPGGCRAGCGEYEPEPPVWRTRGWPIEGGPGKGIERVLDARRRRRRPGLDGTVDAGAD